MLSFYRGATNFLQPGTDEKMSEDANNLDHTDDAAIIGGALRVINALNEEGVIEQYAIGGAVGLLFYVEPFLTDDLDIFCQIPTSGVLLSLEPIFRRLKELGYEAGGDGVSIQGVHVQFLIPPTKLVEEALEQAAEMTAERVPTRVFRYEHLLAIMAETGRPRDKAKLSAALESRKPDQSALKDILKRYNLVDKWNAIST